MYKHGRLWKHVKISHAHHLLRKYRLINTIEMVHRVHVGADLFILSDGVRRAILIAELYSWSAYSWFSVFAVQLLLFRPYNGNASTDVRPSSCVNCVNSITNPVENILNGDSGVLTYTHVINITCYYFSARPNTSRLRVFVFIKWRPSDARMATCNAIMCCSVRAYLGNSSLIFCNMVVFELIVNIKPKSSRFNKMRDELERNQKPTSRQG